LLTIWGRQDPHVPLNGRNLIRTPAGRGRGHFQWHEVNGQHAFLRYEGPRYDPALAYLCYGLVFGLFHRRLG
jgi:carboxymethylenebutenolidase